MTRNSPLAVGLTFGVLALVACGETITEPMTARPPTAVPDFAVAPNTWITRADIPSTERYRLAAATVTNATGQSIVRTSIRIQP